MSETAPVGRNIVLFSDGTGNSSAKLFKTNVWRMYEAIDLGNTATAARQIVYYDEGAGNSAFRPLALLGGVFGYGLKRNVIDLYSFLCRNWRENDRIYLFGFSRGAFTVRVLGGLVQQQGLVPYRGEADLAHQAADAVRRYYADRVPRFPPMRWLLPLFRLLLRGLIRCKRGLLGQTIYDRAKNRDVRIRFVGVWDTVAAYGGPIVELVRAFDDWIRPLSFRNQHLPDNVDYARHALALDDERDAFQPVPWDEPHPTDRDRLKQVWFSGMHADVGGGYPDDSLAYVSLAWMMGEARRAGLELRDDKLSEANRTANAFGPIHDSRAGMGAYYRYQPRLIGAYVKPPEHGAESVEDPLFEEQGLEPRVWVHDSVLARIAAGTDGYAPTTLPHEFDVVGSTPEDADLPADMIAALHHTAAARTDRQESLRDLVWIRRLLYFSTVAASLGLATLPWWPLEADAGLCADSRCYLGDVYGWLRYVLPGIAGTWIDAFASAPTVTTLLLLAIVGFMSLGSATERRLRDGTRRLWREALTGRIEQPASRSLLRRLRTSSFYQRALGTLKWRLLPAMFGLTMLAVLAWTLAIAAAQIRLSLGEGRAPFCTSSAEATLDIGRPCNDLRRRVVPGRTYRVRLVVTEPWTDGGPVSPQGAPAARTGDRWPLSWFGITPGEVGAPFRRVVRARYLQPLLIVIPDGHWNPVQVTGLEMVRQPDGSYLSAFRARLPGRAMIGVNDAVPPWPWSADSFYKGSIGQANTGKACVEFDALPLDGRASPDRCLQAKSTPADPDRVEGVGGNGSTRATASRP